MQIELSLKTIGADLSDYKTHMDPITACATGGVCVTTFAIGTNTMGLLDMMQNSSLRAHVTVSFCSYMGLGFMCTESNAIYIPSC